MPVTAAMCGYTGSTRFTSCASDKCETMRVGPGRTTVLEPSPIRSVGRSDEPSPYPGGLASAGSVVVLLLCPQWIASGLLLTRITSSDVGSEVVGPDLCVVSVGTRSTVSTVTGFSGV